MCEHEVKANGSDERAIGPLRDRPDRALPGPPVGRLPRDELLGGSNGVRMRDGQRVPRDSGVGEIPGNVGRIVGDEGAQNEPLRRERRLGRREETIEIGHPPLWRIARRLRI